eukprot:3383680-Rhodomonas_salina.1
MLPAAPWHRSVAVGEPRLHCAIRHVNTAHRSAGAYEGSARRHASTGHHPAKARMQVAPYAVSAPQIAYQAQRQVAP